MFWLLRMYRYLIPCAIIAGIVQLVYISRYISSEHDLKIEAAEEHESTPSVEYDGINFTFFINVKNKCPWGSNTGTAKKFAVVVVSKLDNIELRAVIRSTWGSFDTEMGSVVFLVGTMNDEPTQERLLKESKLYRDIIQVNVSDEYNLLTYKSMAMLEWLYLFCRNADFYLKADDDAFINMPKVFNATIHQSANRFFLCHTFSDTKPIRNSTSKWYVSREQFASNIYPTYCAGPAYVFSSNILPGLYKSALTSPFISMEDIFITGISASSVNVTYIHTEKVVPFLETRSLKCPMKDSLALHPVKIDLMPSIYSFFLYSKQQCT